MRAAGVDGCRGGWVCVVRDQNTHEIRSDRFDGAEELLCQKPTPDVLAIDVPIGLTREGPRECDVEARVLLGPRSSSVFPSPIRPVLAADSWEEACEIRERIDGKRMSRQAWGIVSKVREVDKALRSNSTRLAWVREVHPEVCFWAWSGAPMPNAKRRVQGRKDRLDLVTRHFGDSAFREVRARYRRGDVADDDILDAFAALWTAERILRGDAKRVPGAPPIDSEGLRMEIVY